MPLITDSERQDFERLIKEAGLSLGDFVVTEELDEFPSRGVAPDTGTVTVTYMPTKARRAYHTGHISKWSAQFEDDLKSNWFQTR